MVKPKKPEIGVWKTFESKSRHKHEKKKLKPNKKLSAKSSNKRMWNMLVRLEISRKFQNIKFIIKIGNGIVFLHQRRFHHIDHISTYHGVLISVCLILVHHGFIIHIRGLFLHICAQITLLIGSRQLISHRLQIIIVLIIGIGLYRKISVKWSNMSIIKMDIWIKIQIWH